MASYDYVFKAYSTSTAYNLSPGDGPDPEFVVLSKTRNLITIEAAAASGTYILELGGLFDYTEPLETPNELGGVISSFRIYQNNQLVSEELLPPNTSASAFVSGDYAFALSLLGGDDYFSGSPFRHDNDNDGIRAGEGNDTFIGYGSTVGPDQFYGEGGIDTSIYRGRLSEYRIEWSDNIWDGRLRDGTNTSGYVVTDTVTARDDTDHLVGVERLQFSDVTLALDIDGVAAEAYRIYKAAFDRQPDSSGLGFWIKQMDAGMSLEAVAQEFINSSEFVRMYGANTSDEQFVDLLYANVLDRQADQSGYDFWIAAFDRGLTRAGLLAEFSKSRENIANVAPLIENGIQYTAYLG